MAALPSDYRIISSSQMAAASLSRTLDEEGQNRKLSISTNLLEQAD
jgi:hypothetical protein